MLPYLSRILSFYVITLYFRLSYSDHYVEFGSDLQLKFIALEFYIVLIIFGQEVAHLHI